MWASRHTAWFRIQRKRLKEPKRRFSQLTTQAKSMSPGLGTPCVTVSANPRTNAGIAATKVAQCRLAFVKLRINESSARRHIPPRNSRKMRATISVPCASITIHRMEARARGQAFRSRFFGLLSQHELIPSVSRLRVRDCDDEFVSYAFGGDFSPIFNARLAAYLGDREQLEVNIDCAEVYAV